MNFKNLKSIWPLLIGVLLLPIASPSSAQTDSQSKAFLKHITKVANDFPFERLEERWSLYTLLEISQSCSRLGRAELAQTYWNRCEKMLDENAQRRQVYTRFRYALELENLEKAESIANQYDDLKMKFLDRISLQRLSRGEKDALKDYPREPMDFWKAVEFGKALVESGDFAAAEKFAKEMKIPHEENDPRTVPAWIYRDIAMVHFENGKIDLAKKYMKKSLDVGGNLFFTGYSLEVDKRRIHGTLTKDLRDFTTTGLRHRDHQGQELVQLLSRALRESGHFKEAKSVVKRLEKERRADGLFRIAKEQMKQKRFNGAEQTVKGIQDPVVKSAGHCMLAAGFWLAGKKELARKYASMEKAELSTLAWDKKNSEAFIAFAKAAATMGDIDSFDAVWKLKAGDLEKARFLRGAFAAIEEKEERQAAARKQ